jgi:hypothetical protein
VDDFVEVVLDLDAEEIDRERARLEIELPAKVA